MSRGVFAFASLFIALSACGHTPARTVVAPPPRLPDAKARAPRPPPRPEWFWEAVDADIRTPARKPADLPVADVTRVEGAAKYWDDLPVEARERLKRDGVLVSGSDAPDPPAAPAPDSKQFVSMGAFYTDLREQRVPHVITLDALYAVVHLGFARAVAEIEETDLAPLTLGVIEKLDARLRAEEVGVGTELGDAYRVARGVIAVARSLADDPSTAKAPAKPTMKAELSAVVDRERALIDAHVGPALSPLLGITIDYSRFMVPSTSARPQLYRALAWLGTAPFTLGGRAEAPGSTITISQARINGRAAMLLARLCTKDIDPATHAAYTRLVRLSTFIYGPPDDLSLTEIDEIATSVGVDLTKPENIANVVRVDKLRTKALTARVPSVYDASGIGGRAGTSARVFGGHASIDSIAMQSLVGPAVGQAQEAAASAPLDRLRQGLRVLPSTVDVPAWLGSKEARTVLHETKADAFDSFDVVLASLQKNRPSAEQPILHASVYGSLIDSLVVWAAVSDGPSVKITAPADRARVESLLTAWTLARHAGQAFSRPKPLPPPATPAELKVAGAPLAVFVEPMPEVIARQVAAIRQLRRGLESLASLQPNSSIVTMLVEVEDILRAALKGAERNANDEALTTEEAAALASLPARLARIEEESSMDTGPAVAIVFSDPTSRRLLASATGKIEPILMLAREPGKEEQMLVVGAHVAHHEVVEVYSAAPGPRGTLNDATWRARLKSPTPPPRAEWTSTFRFVKPVPAPVSGQK